MKTIIVYTLIAIFIFGIIASALTKSNNTNRILIQSTDSEISSVSLSKSAEIITNRLKSFSAEKFDVITIPDKNQIQVTLTNDWDLKVTEKLITQKGTLEFYETCDYKSVSDLLKSDNTLLTLLHEKALQVSTAKIGCSSSAEVNKVNEYLNSAGLNKKCKFAWSFSSKDSKSCLYALKSDNGNGVLLSGTDIDTFKLNKDNSITFKFKKSVIGLWSDITRRNINKEIAMVLDDIVLSAPVVRSVIEGGNSEITGDFTQTQARYIVAIGGNGELPASFEVVK